MISNICWSYIILLVDLNKNAVLQNIIYDYECLTAGWDETFIQYISSVLTCNKELGEVTMPSFPVHYPSASLSLTIRLSSIPILSLPQPLSLQLLFSGCMRWYQKVSAQLLRL